MNSFLNLSQAITEFSNCINKLVLSSVIFLLFLAIIPAAFAEPAQVIFGTDTPCAVNVNSNYTNSTGSFIQSIFQPTPYLIDTAPGTQVSFVYSPWVNCNLGGTDVRSYNFLSASPSSPITSGESGSVTNINAYYDEAPIGSIRFVYFTNTTNITVHLAANDSIGVTGYRISEGTSIEVSPIVDVPSTPHFLADLPWTLTPGDGIKMINVRYRDATDWAHITYAVGTILDTVAPNVTVNQAQAQADPTNGTVINFTAVFSERVNDLVANEVILGGTAGANHVALFRPNGSIYIISVSGMTQPGTVIVSIPAGAAQDNAGNVNTASTSTDNQVTYYIGCADNDKDGYSTDGGSCGFIDCNDNNADIHPGADDSACNGVDNNCNGLVDEGYTPQATPCGVGSCASTGQLICINGQVQDTCTAGIPTPELCDGLDNDCNGQADEGFSMTGLDGNIFTSVGQDCGSGKCQGGITQCSPDKTGLVCGTENIASIETCNGIDDNCNGQLDEELGQTTCGLGVCTHTIENCVNGQAQVCDPMQGASEEVCDGLDNDCNGMTDFEDSGLVLTPCELQDGVCSMSMHTSDQCLNGAWRQCAASNYGDLYSEHELCPDDRVDNNCDGIATFDCAASCDRDGDGYKPLNAPWYCAFYLSGDCDDTNADVHPGAPEAICNGIDNNCNGVADEEYAPSQTTCGIGSCQRNGQLICQSGQQIDTCLPGQPSAETCNNVDDNCNGGVDERICGQGTDNDCDAVNDCSADKCSSTIPWYAQETLNPNHFDSSNLNLAQTYGCSCGQILSKKPGNNNGEWKNGCTQGTLSNWISQTGWAAKKN
jgi:hypothetical protein